MDRSTFFKTLFAGAAAAPAIAKVLAEEPKPRINPAWETAEYEYGYIVFSEDAFSRLVPDYDGIRFAPAPHPIPLRLFR